MSRLFWIRRRLPTYDILRRTTFASIAPDKSAAMVQTSFIYHNIREKKQDYVQVNTESVQFISIV